MDAPSPLDRGAIERLRRLGDDAFVRTMIDLFFSFVGQKLSEAQRAAAVGDSRAVADAAHAIKSTAANAGALRVQELAIRLEKAAREGDGDEVALVLPRLEQAFAEVAPHLEAERAKLGG
jgi:HPt (histidine-containing phosphotransfer) domain-containing protein